MKAIDIVSIVALGLIFYLIMGEGSLNFEKHFKAKPSSSPVQSFESSFEQGLPSDYVPKDPQFFPSEEKLITDLEYRRKRLNYSIEQEMMELSKIPGTQEEKEQKLRELNARHEKVRQELTQIHRKIVDSYRETKAKEEMSNQGLR